MRICDLTTLYIDGRGGGVNTYLIEKARFLNEQPDHSHVIIVPGEKDDRFELEGSRVHSIKSPRLPWNRDHRVITRFREVRSILREESPSLVEVDCAYFLGRQVSRALSGSGVPVVGLYHVHLPSFIAKPGVQRLGGPIAGFVEMCAWKYTEACIRACDRVVVTSPDLRERLEKRGWSKKLASVPLGVNLDLFAPRVGDKDPSRPIRLLYVGRLSHEKDLEVLFSAYEELKARVDHRLQLRLVGDGPCRSRFLRRARDDAGIALPGHVPYGEDLAREYSAADVFVNPSPNETFSLSIAEAMASGLPVVGAARGGPTTLVGAGRGELARPGDPRDFAAKIDKVMTHPSRYGGGRAFVEQGYSWRRTFESLLDVYRGLLSGRHPSLDPVFRQDRSSTVGSVT